MVIDSSLASAGVVLGTPLQVFAVRDSVIRTTLVAPPHVEFQKKACSMTESRRWVPVRVVRGRVPVRNARWDIGQLLGAPDECIAASGITGTEGTFGFCDSFTYGRILDVRARDNSATAPPVIVTVRGVLKDLTIELPPKTTP